MLVRIRTRSTRQNYREGVPDVKRNSRRVRPLGRSIDPRGSAVCCRTECVKKREIDRIVPLTVRTSTHELLIRQGYKLIDDAWSLNGRSTYHHNEDATREFIVSLAKNLKSAGWATHPDILRAFRHSVIADQLIEIEPGGSETSGHFAHYIKAN
jgi:hypothetical protein